MASPSPIPDKDMPEKGQDVRAYWRALGPCARLYNALLNVSFVRGASQDKLEIADGNATISLTDGGGGNHWWYVIVNGQLMAAQFNSGPLMDAGSVPAGTVFENEP